ncbi:MAG: VOC family protein [Bryobacteraceae bacterium]|nr:VOC family protein [Bryobacteraceae bacterium]
MEALIPYLNFDGNCREAMEYYARLFGLQLDLMTFADMPGDQPPHLQSRILHACLTKSGQPLLMASDTLAGEVSANTTWLNVVCESRDEIERLFAELGAGGSVQMPLHDAFWGARFGMLTDRYGVRWMFNYETKGAAA